MTNCKDMENGCCAKRCKPCVQVNVNPCCCHGNCCGGNPANPDHPEQPQGAGRIMLDSDLIIYVRKDGNDNNDGLTDSPCGAKLTISNALRSLFRFDAQGYAMKIIIHEGEYEEALKIDTAYSSIGFTNLTLQAFEGETVTVTQDFKKETILVYWINGIYLNGLTITNSFNAGQNNSCITANGNAICICENCIFVCDTPNNITVYAYMASSISLRTRNTFKVKNGEYAIFSQLSSFISMTGSIIRNENLSAKYYLAAGMNADIKLACTFEGSVDGKPYKLFRGGNINHGGTTPPGIGSGDNDGSGVIS